MKRSHVLGVLAVSAGLLVQPPGAFAETGDVVLRLKGSDVEFAGALKSYDGRTYVVEARAFGLLSLDAERFSCEGQRCSATGTSVATAAATSFTAMDFVSDAATAVDRFAIHGSDTVARELMPALIRDYAKSTGGSVRQHAPFAGRVFAVTSDAVMLDGGAPAAELERLAPIAAARSRA